MRNTQAISVTLPHDMAAMVKAKVTSGEYATESEVIRDGLRTLAARDAALESWLRDEVTKSYDEFLDNPNSGIPADDILAKIQAAYRDRLANSSKYLDNHVIRLLQPHHIKRGKSAYRYSCYIDGMSVSKYKDAVLRKCGADEVKKCIPDLKFDSEHRFIRVERR
jgi:antitoxin ParD1/3/4